MLFNRILAMVLAFGGLGVSIGSCAREGANGHGDASAPKVTIAGNPGPNGQSQSARVVSEEDGVVVAEIGSSLIDQRVAANGAGIGAAALFPPNAVPVGTLVTVEVAAAITHAENLAKLGFDGSQALTAAGPALAVTTLDNAPAVVPFTIVLALPDAASLVEQDLANLAILYHARVGAEFDFRYGVLPRSALQVKDGVVFFTTQIFGVYQAVLLTRPVEEKVETHVATTYETKTQAKAVRPASFAISGAGAKISWTASANATSYRLAVASDATCTKLVASAVVAVPSLEWNVDPALAAGDYFACVIAVGASQTSLAATNNGVSFTIAVAVIPQGVGSGTASGSPTAAGSTSGKAPGAFTINALTHPNLARPNQLSWSPSDNVDHYVVRLVDAGENCDGSGAVVAESTATTVNLPKGAGIGKFACVNAVNAFGEASASNNRLALDNGWQQRADLPTKMWNHESVWTGTKLFAFGGCVSTAPDCPTGNVTNLGHTYDPETDAWTTVSATGAPSARKNHTVVALANGQALVFGGYDSSNTVLNTGGIYDPANNSWSTLTTTNAPSPRSRVGMAVNAAGKAFLFGGTGFNGGYSDEAAFYDPTTNSWTLVLAQPNQPTPRAYAAVLAVSNNRFFVWGGAGATTFDDGAIYDPATGNWTVVSATGAPAARRANTALVTGDGAKVIIWGGCDPAVNSCQNVLDDGHVYDVATDHWTTMSPTFTGRKDGVAVIAGSRMLVWGGEISSGRADVQIAIFDANGNTWTSLPDEGATPVMLGGGAAVWTGKGLLVAGGATEAGAPPTMVLSNATQIFVP